LVECEINHNTTLRESNTKAAWFCADEIFEGTASLHVKFGNTARRTHQSFFSLMEQLSQLVKHIQASLFQGVTVRVRGIFAPKM
jgi:hypothetical protein